MSRRTASLPLVVSATSALSGATTLLLASRQGLLVDIGGFAAGTAVAAVASALLAGGMTLSFITGEEKTRSAILVARRYVIVPIILIATLIAAWWYVAHTQNTSTSVLCGGILVAANLVAELDAVLLQQNHRISTWATIQIASKILAPIAVALTNSYSFSMAAVTLCCAVAIGYSATPYRPKISALNPFRAFTNSYNFSLSVFTIGDTIALRLPFIVAPLALTSKMAGSISTLMSSQQTILAVFSSALYSSMAAQSGSNQGEQDKSLRTMDVLLVGASAVAALFSALAAPIFLRLLGLPTHDYLLPWLLLSLAIFPSTMVRWLQYLSIRAGRSRAATVSSLHAAGVCAFCCSLAVITPSVSSTHTIAAASLVCEVCALTYLIHRTRKRR